MCCSTGSRHAPRPKPEPSPAHSYDQWEMAGRTHIGTLGERPLHASLKRWYARRGDRVEASVDGFVIDLVRGDLLIEIQTRGFSAMKRKLAALLDAGHPVRVVHPIAVDRFIVKIDDDGEEIGRRRSPKHGQPADLFSELVSFPTLPSHPGFELDILLTVEEELRRHSADGPWRRNGWAVVERRLIAVVDSVALSGVADLAGLLPSGLPDPFTTADLASALGRPRRTAQQMAYCLRKMRAVDPVGRRGNAIEYRVG